MEGVSERVREEESEIIWMDGVQLEGGREGCESICMGTLSGGRGAPLCHSSLVCFRSPSLFRWLIPLFLPSFSAWKEGPLK